MPTLSYAEYWDKVYACWMGKNCGGTLGAPLEKIYGEEEPFNIDWYPELREGGIPNDDLEMQLIWLKAVEEQGFDLTARQLAQYWLDYIGYNWDEYGLNKTNLRLGLLPPVSGYFNNWFRDCMGSPIRSEIWACLAPGNPALAARYAIEDASVDHAGGEGLWGEVFNAALEAAAFVEHDPHILLDIAASYIPTHSAVYRAVQAARAARSGGKSWQEARKLVMEATPHYNAQYAPINLGFQALGWLYGTDFGDTLCTTVNCGYDTDCTGATVGALLGILKGRAGLPQKWTEPLGEHISTNASWGGLRNIEVGANRIPDNLQDLTNRVCQQGKRLLALRDSNVQIAETSDLSTLERATLYAPPEHLAWLRENSPLRLPHTLATLNVEIDYLDSPAIVPGVAKQVALHLHNPHADEIKASTTLSLPPGWSFTTTPHQEIRIPALGSITLDYTIEVKSAAHVQNSNTAYFTVQPHMRPAEHAIPLIFVGARRWQIWGPQAGEGSADTRLEQSGEPEQAQDTLASEWQIATAEGNELPTAISTNWTGTLYARLYLWSKEAREARLGIPGTCPRKLWLNNQPILQTLQRSHLRPNYGGDGLSYINTELKAGWNEVLIKYTRDANDPAFAAHFTLAAPELDRGLVDIGWTQLPGESGK